MEVYRLKHVPTGLYFSPGVCQYKRKSNLSSVGKVYSRKPTLPSRASIVKGHGVIRTPTTDWRLMTYNLED